MIERPVHRVPWRKGEPEAHVGLGRRVTRPREAPRARAQFDHAHFQRHAGTRTLDPDRTGDGIGLRRRAVKAGAQAGNGLVLRRFEVARARVPRFDLEGFAGLHAQERFVLPVEGVFAGEVTGDFLHGRRVARGAKRANKKAG